MGIEIERLAHADTYAELAQTSEKLAQATIRLARSQAAQSQEYKAEAQEKLTALRSRYGLEAKHSVVVHEGQNLPLGIVLKEDGSLVLREVEVADPAPVPVPVVEAAAPAEEPPPATEAVAAEG
jgi:hypothetical protein